MFTSFDAFKHRLQLNPGATTWLAVELTLGHPSFIVTALDMDGIERVFFLNGTEELLFFATEEPIESIVDLHLLQPPHWAKNGMWSLVQMQEVLLQETPPDNSKASAVARSLDGVLYGGFPIGVLAGDPGPLQLITVLLQGA